jgi:hypothetical protein
VNLYPLIIFIMAAILLLLFNILVIRLGRKENTL